MSHLVSPSILSADFGNLARDVKMLNRSHADWIHVDVMDGVFVPNISFGFPVLASIRAIASKPLDVHLMIVQPERYVEKFKEAGASLLTVHIEASTHLHRTLQYIRSLGIKAGVALNPHTPVEVLSEVIRDADLVCLMSVNPGYGGQKFIENSYGKIKWLRQLIREKKSSALIEVDGGVDLKNAQKIIGSGGDVLVAGNSVFGSKEPEKTIEELKIITGS